MAKGVARDALRLFDSSLLAQDFREVFPPGNIDRHIFCTLNV
jgi:hypothetical protein